MVLHFDAMHIPCSPLWWLLGQTLTLSLVCIILSLLGLTGVCVVTILEGDEDQLAGVLGEPDAVGVLVEGHLAGVLVTVHLGSGTVQGPGG